jgi:large repetitive protein
MSNPFMKKWLSGALCALALGSTAALAEGDSFYLGTGRDNAYTAPAGPSIINSYARVAAPLGKGDTSIELDSCTVTPCFAPAELVMVLQTTGYLGTPEVKDAPPPFPMSTTEVGRWELARVKSISGTTLELTAPLIRNYAPQVTQVIRVPEFTNVTIGSTSTLTARAWDG